ncbi:MAG: hypothetical protein ACR2LU_06120 [Luteitalea sp.]
MTAAAPAGVPPAVQLRASRHGRQPWRVCSAAVAAGLLLALLLVMMAPTRVSLPVTPAAATLSPVMLSGVHGVEDNSGHVMRWTTGRLRLRWMGEYGVRPSALVFTLAGFPGRQPDQVEVVVNGRRSRHDVPSDYGEIRVPFGTDPGTPLDIALSSLTTRPAGDARDLGVRLEAVTIENRPLAQRLAPVRIVGTLAVIALGALAFLAAAWVAGPAAPSRTRLAYGVAGWLASVVIAWTLAPTVLGGDLRPVLAAVGLAVITAAMLAAGGRHGRGVAATVGLVAGLQALVIATWLAAAFVDAPRWDIWDLVPMLMRQEAQGLSLRDLWAPHNEHRPLVARAVLLANVALTDWNHWYELGVMLVVTAVHFLIVVRYARETGRGRGPATVIALAGAGTFVATATQWENYLQGWQIALVVGAAAVSGSFLLLTTGAPTWRRLAAAASLALLGTASFGSCLLAWPIGALGLAVRRGPGWLARTAAWLVTGGVVGAAYVHGLVHPVGLPPPAPVLSSFTALAQVIYGTCMALAMPVWYAPMAFSDTQSVAWWLLPTLGATGIGVGAALIGWHLVATRARGEFAWLFPALLLVFAAGACALTAIGRVPLGMHAMTASRYIVFTSLFWVGLVLLLTIALPWRSLVARRAASVVAVVIVAAGLRAWVDSLPAIEAHYVGGALAREALLRGDVVGAAVLFPSPPVLDERQQYLRRRKLSLFRPGAR